MQRAVLTCYLDGRHDIYFIDLRHVMQNTRTFPLLPLHLSHSAGSDTVSIVGVWTDRLGDNNNVHASLCDLAVCDIFPFS